MRKTIWIIALLFAASFAQPVFGDGTYIIIFTTSGTPDASGSFTYTAGVFSGFDVTWNDSTFDFTTAANDEATTTIVGCPSAGFFAYLSAAGCGDSPSWGGDALEPVTDFGFAASPATGDCCAVAGPPGAGRISTSVDGSFTIAPATATPEPSSFALMLAGCVFLFVMRKHIGRACPASKLISCCVLVKVSAESARPPSEILVT
jgi:hypothetical protein